MNERSSKVFEQSLLATLSYNLCLVLQAILPKVLMDYGGKI